MVARIGDVNIAQSVDRDTVGLLESRKAAVAIHRAADAGDAGDRAHIARGGDAAQRVVERIDNINVGRGARFHRDAFGLAEAGERTESIGRAAEAGRTGERDDVAAADFADGVVAGVGDVNVARGIHGEAVGVREAGGGQSGTVGRAGDACGARDGGDVASLVDAADRAIKGVGHIDDVVEIDRDALRIEEAGGDIGAAGVVCQAREGADDALW